MRLDPDQVRREAGTFGFQAEGFEKVVHLVDLLDTLSKHPFLKNRLALKGGTALNLFVLDLPRLSVDVDLNYVGTVDRDTMLAERPRIDRAIEAVCNRQGLRVRRTPVDHAGGKWRLTYDRSQGERDWRTVSPDDVAMDHVDVARTLLPLLRGEHAPEKSEVESWCRDLVERCRELLSLVLPFRSNESEFLEQINGQGMIKPELLTDDPEMQSRLSTQPMLLWKAQNVRIFRAGGR